MVAAAAASTSDVLHRACTDSENWCPQHCKWH